MSELSIDKFKSRFDNGARGNRFSTHFMCPKLGINIEGILCKTASLPGKQLEVTDWSAYGSTSAMPTQISHDTNRATFSFLCDSSFSEKQIIEKWLSFIYGATPDGQADPDASYRPKFSYQNEYTGEVDIRQYRMNGGEADSASSHIVKLHDAFPISYEAQTMDYDQVDQILLFTVTFSFRYTTTIYKPAPAPSGLRNLVNSGRSILDIGADVADLADIFGGNGSSIRKTVHKASTVVNSISTADRILGGGR